MAIEVRRQPDVGLLAAAAGQVGIGERRLAERGRADQLRERQLDRSLAFTQGELNRQAQFGLQAQRLAAQQERDQAFLVDRERQRQAAFAEAGQRAEIQDALNQREFERRQQDFAFRQQTLADQQAQQEERVAYRQEEERRRIQAEAKRQTDRLRRQASEGVVRESTAFRRISEIEAGVREQLLGLDDLTPEPLPAELVQEQVDNSVAFVEDEKTGVRYPVTTDENGDVKVLRGFNSNLEYQMEKDKREEARLAAEAAAEKERAEAERVREEEDRERAFEERRRRDFLDARKQALSEYKEEMSGFDSLTDGGPPAVRSVDDRFREIFSGMGYDTPEPAGDPLITVPPVVAPGAPAPASGPVAAPAAPVPTRTLPEAAAALSEVPDNPLGQRAVRVIGDIQDLLTTFGGIEGLPENRLREVGALAGELQALYQPVDAGGLAALSPDLAFDEELRTVDGPYREGRNEGVSRVVEELGKEEGFREYGRQLYEALPPLVDDVVAGVAQAAGGLGDTAGFPAALAYNAFYEDGLELNDYRSFVRGLREAGGEARAGNSGAVRAVRGAINGLTDSFTQVAATGPGAIPQFIAGAFQDGRRDAADLGLKGQQATQYATRVAAIEGGVTYAFNAVGLGGLEGKLGPAGKALSNQVSRILGKRLANTGASATAETLEELGVMAANTIVDRFGGANPESMPTAEEVATTIIAAGFGGGIASNTLYATQNGLEVSGTGKKRTGFEPRPADLGFMEWQGPDQQEIQGPIEQEPQGPVELETPFPTREADPFPEEAQGPPASLKPEPDAWDDINTEIDYLSIEGVDPEAEVRVPVLEDWSGLESRLEEESETGQEGDVGATNIPPSYRTLAISRPVQGVYQRLLDADEVSVGDLRRRMKVGKKDGMGQAEFDHAIKSLWKAGVLEETDAPAKGAAVTLASGRKIGGFKVNPDSLTQLDAAVKQRQGKAGGKGNVVYSMGLTGVNEGTWKTMEWIGDKAKRFVVENADIPKDTRKAREQGAFEGRAYENEFAAVLKDLDQAATDAYAPRGRGSVLQGVGRATYDMFAKGGTERIPADQLAHINDYWRGDTQSLQNISEQLREPVIRAGKFRDAMESELKAKGLLQGDLDVSMEDGELYLHRSYEAFRNEDYAPTDEAFNSAVAYLKDKAKADDRELTNEQAVADVMQVLDYAKQIAQGAAPGKKPSGLFFDVSALKQRKEVAQEIEDLLGLQTDPIKNMIRTADKQIGLLTNHVAHQNMAKSLSEQGLLSDEPTAENLARVDASTTSALRGKYTTPEVRDALRELNKVTERSGPIWELMRTTAVWAKYQATINNPVGHIRNVWSNMSRGMMHGVTPDKVLGHLGTLSSKDPEKRSLVNKLIRLGVLENEVESETIRNLAGRTFEQNVMPSKLLMGVDVNWMSQQEAKGVFNKIYTGPLRALTKAKGFAEHAWRAEDAAGKIAVWESEVAKRRQRYESKDKTKTLEEIEQEAADFVRDTVWDYAKAPKIVKQMSANPLISDFPTFYSENIRTLVNTFRYAAREARSSDPVERQQGVQRLATATAMTSAPWALAAATAMALGKSYQDYEDEEQFVADWDKDAPRASLPFESPDGEPQFINLKYTFPDVDLTTPFIAAMRGEDWGDSLLRAFHASAGQLATTSMVNQRYIDAMGNRKPTGGDITKREGVRGIAERVQYGLEVFRPGFMRQYKRLDEAFSGERTESGQLRSPEAEVVALAGFRTTPISKETSIGFASSDMRSSIYGARGLLLSKVFSYATQSEDDLADIYAETLQTRNTHLLDMQKMTDAAVRQGMSRQEVFQAMTDRGTGKQMATDIIRGVAHLRPMYIDSRTFEDRLPKKFRNDPAKVQEYRDRVLFVNGLARAAKP